ncbi:hypothetical protein SDC9_125051 [bioreactor metagenome]|uniref:Uncharacterized protein n=1 Tax=bioreactor metagenome TaxID=1076179 RepID=A0A645CM63_9ZZZZ
MDKLGKDRIIIELLDNNNATHHTARSYLQSIKQYTEFTGLNPEELLAAAEADAGLPPRQRKLKSFIIG